MWIGTAGAGLVRLRDAKFTPFGVAEGLADARAYTASAARDGSVWVGTKGGASHVRGGRVVGRVTSADGLPSDDVVAVLAARDGSVWIAPYGAGLCRRGPGGALACYGEADGLPSSYALALYESRAGRLLVGTEGGLSRFENGRFVPVAGAPEAPVLAVAEDAGGALWVGGYGAGLHVRPLGGVFKQVADADVIAILARPGGGVWAGTDGRGLLRVRPAGDGYAVRAFGAADGLPSNIVLAALDGGDGAPLAEHEPGASRASPWRRSMPWRRAGPSGSTSGSTAGPTGSATPRGTGAPSPRQRGRRTGRCGSPRTGAS